MNKVSLWVIAISFLGVIPSVVAQEAPIILGNGGLTVQVLPNGAIDTVHWPAPGIYPQTVSISDTDGPVSGFQWGMVLDQTIYWITDPEWQITSRHFESNVLETTVEREIEGVFYSITIQTFLHPQLDMLFSVCRVTGAESITALVWRSAIEPVAIRLAETKPPDDIPEVMRNFAGYTRSEPSRVVQFRPRHPGATDWKQARILVQSKARSANWDVFERGTYFGLSSPNEISGLQWASPDSIVSDIKNMQSFGSTGSMGRQATNLRIAPELVGSELTAMVSVSFADTKEALENLMDFGALPVSEKLLEQLRIRYASEISPLKNRYTHPEWSDPTINRYLFLRSHTNRQTGAAIYALTPEQEFTDPFLESWCAAALDAIGQHNEAEAHLRFLQSLVQMDYEPGRPLGSLPEEMWTTGQLAAPIYKFSFADPGWMLWAMNQHSLAIPLQQRRPFLQKVWREVEYSADFLADWIQGNMPYRSNSESDPSPAMYLGLVNAIDMSETLSIPVSSRWIDAKLLLELRLESNMASITQTYFPGMDPMALSLILSYLPGISVENRNRIVMELLENAEVTKSSVSMAALMIAPIEALESNSEIRHQIFQLITEIGYNSPSPRLVPDQQDTLTAALELITLQRFLSLVPHETR